MEMPQIILSKWFQWDDRAKIENSDSPGVYVLAKFNKTPQGSANPQDNHIVYIGETCNNSLRGRWYQFNRSAFQSKDGHSGGWTYNDTFKDQGADLFVAALPVPNLSDNLRHLFIRYVERKLIWEYALKYGSQPKLNRK